MEPGSSTLYEKSGIRVDLYPRLKILVTIVVRYKYYLNRGQRVQGRFWRTYGGAEVDYIWKSGRMDALERLYV